jgi:hypothetical protein
MNDLDLAKITEIFLVPNTILVGALGFESNDRLKTGISSLGLVACSLWWICSWTAWFDERQPYYVRVVLLAHLPFLFVVCWLISLGVHACGWYKDPHKTKIKTTRT